MVQSHQLAEPQELRLRPLITQEREGCKTNPKLWAWGRGAANQSGEGSGERAAPATGMCTIQPEPGV